MNFKYNDIKTFLRKPYSPNNSEWKDLLRTMFKRVEFLDKTFTIFDQEDKVTRGGQFGLIRLEDGKNIALFEVQVADNVKIARNRVALREIAVRYIDQNMIHGALVFYHNPKQAEYRLSFMSKQSEITEEGEFVKSQTQPKRFTYLLGSNEPCSTAAKRIEKLIADNTNGFISIKTVMDAFSVEKLSKDFFKEYKETHYNNFIIFLTGEDHKGKIINELEHHYLESIFKNNKKDAREFVKKLLGRIIFMYFVQKKGWLGCVPSLTLPKGQCY